MANQKKPSSGRKPPHRKEERQQDQGATLKDLLNPEILSKLKAQGDALKAEEKQRAEEKKQQEEEARKREQKRLDNDFGHLLANSSQDWHKFK